MPMIEQDTENRNGWTLNTLFVHVQAEFRALRLHQETQLQDLRRQLDERYATQTKALDAAFSAASLGVATALTSARDASTKAEENAEKRFESFRTETSMRLDGIAEKQVEEAKRYDDSINKLTTRMDLNQGQGSGIDRASANSRLMWAQVVSTGGFLVAVLALLFRWVVI